MTGVFIRKYLIEERISKPKPQLFFKYFLNPRLIPKFFSKVFYVQKNLVKMISRLETVNRTA